jgi:hypothetical protein
MEINKLLESANPYKSQQSDATRLASKWNRTGLLKGLEGEDVNNMSMMLENQAKQLVVEQSSTGGGVAGGSFTPGAGEQWAGIALPLVRKVFGMISAKDFVSVQPMNLPSGLVFFLDFKYGTNQPGTPAYQNGSVYGNLSASGDFRYGDAGNSRGGLYGGGRFAYATNNLSSSQFQLSSSVGEHTTTVEAGNFDSDLNYDTDLSASLAVNGILPSTLTKVTISTGSLSQPDLQGIRAFEILSGSGKDAVSYLPLFTRINDEKTLDYFLSSRSNSYSNGYCFYSIPATAS